jgi:lipid II:glycine glycyltransferase (peptidoglycan interpeptide bridge formation enzyme)
VTSVYKIDPIQDLRWRKLVQVHPSASVFHTVEWLNALRHTYSYEPVVFTTSAPTSELKDGLAFCYVRSWLTGKRLVSLPFSDHCEPLYESVEELDFLVRYLQTALDHKELKYLEVRPINEKFREMAGGTSFQSTGNYVLHRIDLRSSLDELFRHFNKDSIQRRIRRAERAGLVERCGRSEELIKDFYGLLVLTRSRHHVPPQPYIWFRNLIHFMGDSLEIRVAYKDDKPIASILTLRFRETVYFKYGCSNSAFNNLGATPLLLWRAIEGAKSFGAKEFDLGRTDEDNAGLISFKDKWAPVRQPLHYWRFPPSPNGGGWRVKMAKQILAKMPDRLLTATGNLIYRHIG